MTVGPWQHLDPPVRVPAWVPCDGFTGNHRLRGVQRPVMETRLVMRAVALPQSASPQWAVIVDLPFTVTIEERLREETGIRLGAATASVARRAHAIPRGRLLETDSTPKPMRLPRLVKAGWRSSTFATGRGAPPTSQPSLSN